MIECIQCQDWAKHEQLAKPASTLCNLKRIYEAYAALSC